jgi:sugar phosphate permease
LSYLFGDVAARRFKGWLIGNGVGWRGVFLAAAGLSKAEDASESALFPLFGGVSVLLAGFISDK